MCGIAGYWQENAIDFQDKSIITRMLERIRHRGPDSYHYHSSEKNRLIMGHTRLTIIDLHTGDQPFIEEYRDGSGDKLILTVNGEFYDYKRMRADLMSRGERLQTKSDSELALKLYKREGLDFVHKLRGEFAFTLFDEKERRLLLVRDRFGVRPLFYHIHENNIYYASEIKSLFAHPRIPKKIDLKGSVHQLMQTMVPGTSAFENIHALKPGHMLIAQRDGKGKLQVRQEQYWDMDFPHPSVYKEHMARGEKYWIEELRRTLIEAVTLRLEADVPVGCYLSGGIDSCSILGLASGAQQSPVKAFTISFDHDDYDELPIAKEMAESMKADQEVLYITHKELYGENYLKALWHSERTFYNTLGVAKMRMSQRVKEHGYRVVVTGEGSDELFAGYPFFKKDYFLHALSKDELAALSRQGAVNPNFQKVFQGAILSEQDFSHEAFQDLMGFTPSWLQNWMETLGMIKPMLSSDMHALLNDYDPVAAIAAELDPAKLAERHPLDKVQYSWSKTMLEGQILNWGGDRVDMANSMESRPPFLDHHLAELATQIPPALRIKGNVEKYILREAVRGVLPEVLYKREKFAFMAPPGHTEKNKQSALNILVDSYLNEDSIQNLNILDSQAVEKFMKEYNSDKSTSSLVRKDALLNHMIGLHALHAMFVQEENPFL